MAKLTELAVRNARIPIGSTKTEMLLSDGDGLNLLIRNPNTRKTWLFRYTRLGGAHKLHIGAYPSVSLAVAREAANDLRRLLRQGLDPIDEREREAKALREATAAREAKITVSDLFNPETR